MEGVVAVMKIHIKVHLYGYPCFFGVMAIFKRLFSISIGTIIEFLFY